MKKRLMKKAVEKKAAEKKQVVYKQTKEIVKKDVENQTKGESVPEERPALDVGPESQEGSALTVGPESQEGSASEPSAHAAPDLFEKRLARHRDELKWLYMELYDEEAMFDELCESLRGFYADRRQVLKTLDEAREREPEWFKQNDMLGMMLYVEQFAGNLKGVEEKIGYLKACGVNYVHLMPLLETPKGRSDGGYAVSNFRRVQENLGVMEDLAELADEFHRHDMSVCLDFVMNHTSEDHEWAVKARAGEEEYRNRYFFYQDYSMPAMFERTVPQVFPTTAPGNFTYLKDQDCYVMTTFYPYQWDLNYRNPAVFNEMVYNFLYLANQGVDVLRIDAVPYIWKQIGTSCRNLPQVHSIVRMMRMITEIVCPGVLLLGEVVMEPEKVAPYFGTVEKPECHMLYNVTTMAATWNSVAARDARLLKNQMDVISSLPKQYTFLNYLRCHDDIGWGLDYDTLRGWGMEEADHKKYLNDFFTGSFPGSFSRGELYNDDPATGDARFCGTSASMCGVEKAGFEQDEEGMRQAVQLDVMLHAFMLTLSGIPVLYSGDEIGQVNDYTYKDDPEKAPDSRYIHRGSFKWELVENIKDEKTVQGQIFGRLRELEKIRGAQKAFISTADTWTLNSWEDSVLCLVRYYEGDKIIGIFNFSEQGKMCWINEADGTYTDLVGGAKMEASGVPVPGYGFYWLKRDGRN